MLCNTVLNVMQNNKEAIAPAGRITALASGILQQYAMPAEMKAEADNIAVILTIDGGAILNHPVNAFTPARRDGLAKTKRIAIGFGALA